jgi:competence protein ComEC
MRTAKDAFLAKEWLSADADARTASDPSLTEGVSCDGGACVASLAGGAFIALTQRPEALADDCERAVLIVTARPVPHGCAAAVIDAERLRRQGGLALRRNRNGFTIDAVRAAGLDRPWSPAISGEGEPETTIRIQGAPVPRAIDATPSESDLQSED